MSLVQYRMTSASSNYDFEDDVKFENENISSSIKLSDVTIKTLTGHCDDVTCCCFSSDQKRLVSGRDDYTLKVWDLEMSEVLFTLTGHTKQIKCVQFSPNNQKIASSGADCCVFIWEASTGTRLNSLTGVHVLSVECVSFSHRVVDGSEYLCSGSWDHTAVVWDLASSNPIFILRDHSSVVQCCSFSMDERKLATASWDYTINLYDISNILLSTLTPTKVAESSAVENCKASKVSAVKSSTALTSIEVSTKKSCADSNVSAVERSATLNNTVSMMERLDVFKCLRYHKGNIKCLAFSSADDHYLASASWDCEVCIWNSQDGVLLRVLQGHLGYVQACAFSLCGTYLASAGDDEQVIVWDVKTGEVVKCLEAYTEEIHQLSFTREGTLMCSGPNQLTFYLY